LGVSRDGDILRFGDGAFEQGIETLVISGKVVVNFSRHRKYLLVRC
jgi:hypothetical protein